MAPPPTGSIAAPASPRLCRGNEPGCDPNDAYVAGQPARPKEKKDLS